MSQTEYYSYEREVVQDEAARLKANEYQTLFSAKPIQSCNANDLLLCIVVGLYHIAFREFNAC